MVFIFGVRDAITVIIIVLGIRLDHCHHRYHQYLEYHHHQCLCLHLRHLECHLHHRQCHENQVCHHCHHPYHQYQEFHHHPSPFLWPQLPRQKRPFAGTASQVSSTTTSS